jgi:hypothetical protein
MREDKRGKDGNEIGRRVRSSRPTAPHLRCLLNGKSGDRRTKSTQKRPEWADAWATCYMGALGIGALGIRRRHAQDQQAAWATCYVVACSQKKNKKKDT